MQRHFIGTQVPEVPGALSGILKEKAAVDDYREKAPQNDRRSAV